MFSDTVDNCNSFCYHDFLHVSLVESQWETFHHTLCIYSHWYASLPDEVFEGFFCIQNNYSLYGPYYKECIIRQACNSNPPWEPPDFEPREDSTRIYNCFAYILFHWNCLHHQHVLPDVHQDGVEYKMLSHKCHTLINSIPLHVPWHDEYATRDHVSSKWIPCQLAVRIYGHKHHTYHMHVKLHDVDIDMQCVFLNLSYFK